MSTPVVTRTPYDPAALEALLEVVDHHPAPGVNRSAAREFLERLAPGPAAIIDLSADGERALLAVVIDNCISGTRSAPFELLAWRQNPGADAVLDRGLAEGEDYVRAGPLRRLEVGLDERLPSLRALLERRGYREFYRTHVMTRRAEGPLPHPARSLPPDLRWQDFDERQAAELHALTLAAFAGLPGTQVRPLEAQSEAPRRPSLPTRVLMDGDRLAAWVTVRFEPDEPDSGHIQILGRHPDYHAAGLGDHLLLEGLTRLKALGARRISLDVTASNRSAMTLYQRFGFEVESSSVTWCVDL